MLVVQRCKPAVLGKICCAAREEQQKVEKKEEEEEKATTSRSRLPEAMAGRWRRDDNPFEEGDGDVNPFSHPRPTPLPPEPVGFYNDIGASEDIPLGTKKDLKKKERELLAKEAELNRREQEIKRREEALARAGVFIEQKNWPPFFPIVHVDISNDIPVHLQKVQYVAFASLLGLVICLLWNLICVTAAWISGANPKIWFIAVIYLITGCPGAYYLWYRPLYRAMRKESTFSYGWFFLFYFFHIVFCIYAVAAPSFFPSGRSLTGVFQGIYEISDNKYAVGIMYFVGFALFVLEALLSIWVMQKVFWFFRGKGNEAAMRSDAAGAPPF